MSSNVHGFNNEVSIAEYVNNKKYADLNLNMKEFVKYICQTKEIPLSDDTIIKSTIEPNNKLKQDIYFFINNKKICISIKMGTGNSIHQEKIEDFISFIKNYCNADEKICNLWRFFIWADGTLDGTGSIQKNLDGEIISRFSATYFKKKYPNERNVLQNFLNKYKEILIERAIFIGNSNSSVDFIYHGTYKQGKWISKNEALKFLVEKQPTKRACLSLGGVTVQAWNVSIRGTSESKRGQIQLKYGKLKEDLDLLMKTSTKDLGTFFGDSEEFEFSRTLNKNKKHHMWKTLLPDISDYSNYYIVKVSSNQLSKLSGKKVKTKSDAYVIKASISNEILFEKEYTLEESDINKLTYTIVPNSGISIKMKHSKNYTYQKFTKKSFIAAFNYINDIEFWLTSLLVYSSDKERYKNEKIILDLGNSFEEYLLKVSEKMQIQLVDTNTKKFWDTIRRKAQNFIKEKIINNNELIENIFTGRYWFEDPYHADFIYENNNLKKNIITDFSITTGSGRSKGKYTIEIVPNK